MNEFVIHSVPGSPFACGTWIACCRSLSSLPRIRRPPRAWIN